MKFFDEVFEDKTKFGTKLKTDEYEPAGRYVIIDQGQNEIAGYTNLEEGVFTDIPAIIFGDHTRIIKYVNTPFYIGADGVKILKSKDESVNYKYLYYALKNINIPNTGYNRHFKWLKEAKICLPSKEYQDSVVETLDKINEIIIVKKQQLSLLDELIKSRFVEHFGDVRTNSKGFKTKKGVELFKISNGKAVPNDKRFEKGIPAYGGNGISWYTDDVLYEQDTIVIGRVGFQSGNVHLVKGPVWITDNAMYLSELYDDSLSLVFLCEMMEQIDFTKQQDAGDLKKVTQKPFMEMEYILPPKNLQSNYMAFVEHIDKSKLMIQKSLQETQLLMDSLMQKYFG